MSIDHANRAHAALGASSCYRWTACPGSVRLSAGIESKSSAYAEEGTAAHQLCEICLRNGQDAIEWVDRKLPAKYGAVFVTAEMAEAAQIYVDYIRAHILAGDVVQIEQRFDLSALGVGTPMFGTADAVVYIPDYRKLIVVDFKYGAGLAVEAEGNPQLRYYALGSLLSMPDAAVDTIDVVVVQPRAHHWQGPIRSETITAYDLSEWSAELVSAAKRTMDTDAPLAVGSHCTFCPAYAICPEQQSRALAILENDFGPVTEGPPAPETLTPDEIGAILEHEAKLDGVVAWFKAVKAHAYSLAVNGTAVPGTKLVAGKEGNRAWADEDDAALALELAGVAPEDMWVRKLITPAAAERIVGKKAAKDLAQYVTRKPGVPGLVPASDKRPAIECGATADFVALTSE